MRSKKVISNIIPSLIKQIVVIICGFIVPRAIITTYGSEVNGLISSITQFLAAITVLEAGIGPVVKSLLYKPIAKKNRKEVVNILGATNRFFTKITIVFAIYIILLMVIYPFIIVKQFSYLYTMSLIIIISLSILAEYYFGMVYSLYLQARQKTYVISRLQTISYLLNMLSIVILVKLNVNIHIVKLVSSLFFVIRPIVLNIYVRKKYKVDIKEADKEYSLEHKWDGIHQHLAAIARDNTDIIILTFFKSMAEVSVYAVYNLIIKGIKSLLETFSSGIEAMFGEMIAKDETKELNRVFTTYETVYFTIVAIIYICTLVLIVPFVKVYTRDIMDVNYIRPVFAVILTLSGFVWSIRMPYSELISAAGHFNQTKKGAWIEIGVNIILSLVLVWKFGIVGVAIGTLVSLLIRTIEFVIYASKNILNRSVWYGVRKITVVFLEMLLLVVVLQIIPSIQINSYSSWCLQGLIMTILSTIVVTGTNFTIFKSEAKVVKKIIKRLKKRK